MKGVYVILLEVSKELYTSISISHHHSLNFQQLHTTDRQYINMYIYSSRSKYIIILLGECLAFLASGSDPTIQLDSLCST